MGCVLGQHDKSGMKERVVYYLSKMFTDCESRYTTIKKAFLCTCMVYETTSTIHVVLHHMTDIKNGSFEIYLWKNLLIKQNSKMKDVVSRVGHNIYDKENHERKHYRWSFRRQCNRGLLALKFWFPRWRCAGSRKRKESDWWTMYFDRVVNMYGNGAGAMIISPNKKQYLFSIKVQFECTNNTIKYEACILRLEVALELKTQKLDVYGELILIICQVKQKWQIKDEKLIPY